MNNKQFEINAKSAALYVINENRKELVAAHALKRVSKLWWSMNGRAALANKPAAACPQCGGWASCGGMAQFRNDTKASEANLGRIGCICHKP